MKMEPAKQLLQAAPRIPSRGFNYRGPGQALKSFYSSPTRRSMMDLLVCDQNLEKFFANK